MIDLECNFSIGNLSNSSMRKLFGGSNVNPTKEGPQKAKDEKPKERPKESQMEKRPGSAISQDFMPKKQQKAIKEWKKHDEVRWSQSRVPKEGEVEQRVIVSYGRHGRMLFLYFFTPKVSNFSKNYIFSENPNMVQSKSLTFLQKFPTVKPTLMDIPRDKARLLDEGHVRPNFKTLLH